MESRGCGRRNHQRRKRVHSVVMIFHDVLVSHGFDIMKICESNIDQPENVGILFLDVDAGHVTEKSHRPPHLHTPGQYMLLLVCVDVT